MLTGNIHLSCFQVENVERPRLILPAVSPGLQAAPSHRYLIVVETFDGKHDVVMQMDSDYTMLFNTQALAEAYAADHLESDYRVFER